MTARRPRLWAFFELFALCGFAIAQPLLDVTGQSPDVFLFRRADRLDIVALVLGLLLLPPLVMWGCEVVVGLVSERFRRYLHLALVAGLVTLVAIQVAKKLTGLRGPVVVAIALVVGALAAVVYARASWPRPDDWSRRGSPGAGVYPRGSPGTATMSCGTHSRSRGRRRSRCPGEHRRASLPGRP